MKRSKRLLGIFLAVMMLLAVVRPGIAKVKADEPPYPNIKGGTVMANVELDEDGNVVYTEDTILEGDYVDKFELHNSNAVELVWVEPDTVFDDTPVIDRYSFNDYVGGKSFRIRRSDGTKPDKGEFLIGPGVNYDEATGDYDYIDGVMLFKPTRIGEYYIEYIGDKEGKDNPDNARFYFDVTMPDVAAYNSDDEPSEETLIGDEVYYTDKDREYFIKKVDNEEGYINQIMDCKTIGDTLPEDVEITEIGEDENLRYDVVISDDCDHEVELLVEYVRFKLVEGVPDYDSMTIKTREINFSSVPKLGLVMSRIIYDEEGKPTYYVGGISSGRENIKELNIKNENDVFLSWIRMESGVPVVSPIKLSDLDNDNITFLDYESRGVVDTVEIAPMTRWDDEKQKDVEVGDGFFTIKPTALGDYSISYNGDDHEIPEGEEDDYRLYNFTTSIPEVAAYTEPDPPNMEVGLESLIGRRVEFDSGNREFYINRCSGKYGDGRRYKVAITSLAVEEEFAKSSVTLTKTEKNNYKVKIA